MNLANHQDGAVLTYTTACTSVEIARTRLEQAAEELVWQVENRVWTVLGYADWDEMREAEYGGAAVIVPRADRPQLVARLRDQGLTQRQAANTLGVSVGTVNNDVFKTEHGQPKPTKPKPDIVDAEVIEPPSPARPRLVDDEEIRRASERRAGIASLESVVTFLDPRTRTPRQMAESYADVLDEFDADVLDRSAATLTAIADLKKETR